MIKGVTLGGVEILIEAIDDEIQLDTNQSDDESRYTKETGIKEKIASVSNNIDKIVGDIAAGISQSFLQYDSFPSSIEIELSLSLSGKSDLWIISQETKGDVKVKMTWNKNQH